MWAWRLCPGLWEQPLRPNGTGVSRSRGRLSCPLAPASFKGRNQRAHPDFAPGSWSVWQTLLRSSLPPVDPPRDSLLCLQRLPGTLGGGLQCRSNGKPRGSAFPREPALPTPRGLFPQSTTASALHVCPPWRARWEDGATKRDRDRLSPQPSASAYTSCGRVVTRMDGAELEGGGCTAEKRVLPSLKGVQKLPDCVRAARSISPSSLCPPLPLCLFIRLTQHPWGICPASVPKPSKADRLG